MSQWSITIWIEYGLVCLVDTLQHLTFGRIQIFIIKTWSTPEFGWQWMFDQNEEICFILLALLSTALVAAHVVPFTLTCLFCEISEHKTHLTLNSQFTFHFLPCLLPSSSTSTTSCASLSPFWQKQPPHWPAVPQCATVWPATSPHWPAHCAHLPEAKEAAKRVGQRLGGESTNYTQTLIFELWYACVHYKYNKVS